MIPFILGIITGAFVMILLFVVALVITSDEKNPGELSDQELQDLAQWEEERRRRLERRTLPRL